jgi:signal transduction histidine kinase
VSTAQEISHRLSGQLHEISQPFSVLQGTLELALLESRTAEDYRRSIEQALSESARLANCFEQLRDVVGELSTTNRIAKVTHV